MLKIGITTRSFQGLTISDTAKRLSAGGFAAAELCFVHPDLDGWAYNGTCSLEGITPARVKEAVRSFTGRGVDGISIGLYTDSRDPDESKRKEAVEYTKRYIEFAAEAGVPTLATECGFTPGRRGLSADTYESDYHNLKETLRTVCLEAEKSGVHLALEGCVLDVIPSPRRQKNLIEELEAESQIRLGAVLDPANFLDNSDEEGMFYYLKHDILYSHGKDRKFNAAHGVNIGEGDVDWIKFMSCAIRYADKKPFILEYCDKDNCLEMKKRAEGFYDDAFQSLLSRIN